MPLDPVRECRKCHEMRRHEARGLCRRCYYHEVIKLRYTPKLPEPRIWLGDRLERLRELHKEGLTYSAIAERFGVTKNAIVGACDRNGLTRTPFLTTAQRLDALHAALDAVMAIPVERKKDDPHYGIDKDRPAAVMRKARPDLLRAWP